MASDLRVSRHNAKLLKRYTDDVEELFETMALDDEQQHLVTDDLLDLHYTIRYIAEELNKRTVE